MGEQNVRNHPAKGTHAQCSIDQSVPLLTRAEKKLTCGQPELYLLIQEKVQKKKSKRTLTFKEGKLGEILKLFFSQKKEKEKKK